VGNAERRVADRAADPQDPRVVGRYERDDALATLQVNQAGGFIVCWHVDYATKALTKLEGDRISNQAFQLRLEFRQNKVGQLSSVLDGELILDLSGNKTLFRRVGASTTLSETTLTLVPTESRELARRHQHFPLSSVDRRRILAALDPGALGPMINAVLDAPNSPGVVDNLKRGQLAEVVDNHIGVLFGSLNVADQPLAQQLAQQQLLTTTLTRDGDTRPMLEWMQSFTTRVEAERLGPTGQMEQLEKHLKLKAGPTVEHVYAFELSVIGASVDVVVGAGAFIGSLDIKEVDPKDKTRVLRFIGTFSLAFLQASGGPSLGVNVASSTSGEATSPYVWQPSNFPGLMTLVDVGAAVSIPVPITKTGFSATEKMFIRGNGEFPEMMVDFSGASQQVGVGVGAALTEALGYISSDPNAAKRPPLGSHRFEQDYTLQGEFQNDIHFKFGSAILTDEARQLLRVLCGNELSAMRSAQSQLTIESHADCVDTEERNLELSRLRAANTLQAIKDILGADFAIPDKQIVLRGLGEQGAIEAGDKDRTENPVRRKSEVVLNARLVLTLFGRP
jgi:outer membrane protein OmpA-like peptidoglycan-associated protein